MLKYGILLSALSGAILASAKDARNPKPPIGDNGIQNILPAKAEQCGKTCFWRNMAGTVTEKKPCAWWYFWMEPPGALANSSYLDIDTSQNDRDMAIAVYNQSGIAIAQDEDTGDNGAAVLSFGDKECGRFDGPFDGQNKDLRRGTRFWLAICPSWGGTVFDSPFAPYNVDEPSKKKPETVKWRWRYCEYPEEKEPKEKVDKKEVYKQKMENEKKYYEKKMAELKDKKYYEKKAAETKAKYEKDMKKLEKDMKKATKSKSKSKSKKF